MPITLIFSAIWGFISKYPKELIIALVLAFMGWQYWDIGHLKGQLATATADNKTFSVANTKLNGEISDQNKSILALKAAGDIYAKQIADGAKQADAVKASYQQMLADMKKKITPKTCDGAMQRLLDDAVARKKP